MIELNLGATRSLRRSIDFVRSRSGDTMLASLRVRDLVIIEKLDLEFHKGFNVLTGETGAGKSVLIEAIGLSLGSRGKAHLVRSAG